MWKSNSLKWHFLVSFWLIAIAMNGCSQSDSSQDNKKGADQASEKKKARDYSSHVVVEKETISWDGKPLPRFPKMEALEKVFGKPDRKSELANVIFTWDNLGIIAYQKPGESKVYCLTIYYSKPQYDYEPAKSFTGCIHIGKQTFDMDSDVSQLEKEGFKAQSYAPFLYSTDKPGYSIFFEISEKRNAFSYTWK